MFKSLSAGAHTEIDSRRNASKNVLKFGVEYLDDALRGIFEDDLILLGAPSGVGKTQLCCNIALANLADGKKVHYIALEAGQFEIERRMKWPLVAERFFADPNRPRLETKLNYPDWLLGKFIPQLDAYERESADYFATAYRDFYVYYKDLKFGVTELIQSVLWCAEQTDLILIDHVHYFDFDDDNENRAMREIAKTVRRLTQDQQKPIVLVAHLRKRDRSNEDLVAGMEEFHGSSDLFKIATKVITVAPGKPTLDGNYETYFRIPKNRHDQGVSRYIGREIFSPKRGGYEPGQYAVGWADQKRSTGFAGIAPDSYPSWARRPEVRVESGSTYPGLKRASNMAPGSGRSRSV